MNEVKLTRLVLILRWLIITVMVLQIVEGVSLFLTDQDVYLEFNGETWRRSISAFDNVDQIFIGLIVFIPTFVLLWGLFQLIKMCNLFDQGVIFAQGTITCFKQFSLSLIVLSGIETLGTPALLIYFWVRGIYDKFPDVGIMLILDTLEISLLAFGVLCFLITRIMEISLEQKEELELTI